jgi:hypothetical protein
MRRPVPLAGVDQPPKGASDGDTVESRDRLLNAATQFGLRSGARVGSDHGRFPHTSTHSALNTYELTMPAANVA